MKKMISIVALFLLFSNSAQSYIPRFDYILTRTANTHGSGIYLIDQDIIFTGGNNSPVTLHEQWLIEDGKSLRVRVTGKSELNESIAMTFLYNDQNRYTIDEHGQRRALKASEEFIEPLFHFRSPSFLKEWLYSIKMIPRWALADPPKIKKIEDIKVQDENFVRLSRSLGVVNYVIGSKPTQEMPTKLPQLWIEQDFFNIRKWRTPKEALILADKYQQHRNNLWFPQMREVRWDNNRAIITVTQVKNFPNSSQLRKRLAVSSLDVIKEPELKANLPKNEIINDFYNRFR